MIKDGVVIVFSVSSQKSKKFIGKEYFLLRMRWMILKRYKNDPKQITCAEGTKKERNIGEFGEKKK